MIRKDLTIRYACGSYWIISTDVHLYENALQDTKEFILLLKQNGCMEEL